MASSILKVVFALSKSPHLHRELSNRPGMSVSHCMLIHNLKNNTVPLFCIHKDGLKSANLLHKRGLDDSQSHTTVRLFVRPSGWIA